MPVVLTALPVASVLFGVALGAAIREDSRRDMLGAVPGRWEAPARAPEAPAQTRTAPRRGREAVGLR